jgi:hypothetical protein
MNASAQTSVAARSTKKVQRLTCFAAYPSLIEGFAENLHHAR